MSIGGILRQCRRLGEQRVNIATAGEGVNVVMHNLLTNVAL